MIRSYPSLFFWLGLTIGASLILFHTSDRVTALDHQLRELNAEIDGEEASLHVLKAEWVYLANPARIEAQTRRHLVLQPTEPRRIAALPNMSDLLPSRGGVSETRFAQKSAPGAAVQASAEQDKSAEAIAAKPAAPKDRHDRVFALLNEGRINDHMVMQHSAAAETTGSAKRSTPKASDVARVLTGSNPDRIGALIGTMGLRQ